MAVEIRLPNITGKTEKEQLLQLKSYLYQLSEQLQWAFDNIETTGGSGNGSYVVNQAPRAYTPSSGSSGGGTGVNFAELKALLIKSADIVDAYYEEIHKRLQGLYVAQSDFGTYAEATELLIEANSQSITQNYTNTQTLISEANGRIDGTNDAVGDLSSALSTVNNRVGDAESALADAKKNINDSIQDVSNSVSLLDELRLAAEADLQGGIDELEIDLFGLKEIVVGVTGYIKSGELYKNNAGVPVYGIEIGQDVDAPDGTKVFSKFARFISDRLSFFDKNGTEVAYISDEKLYIGQAEILTRLKIGKLVEYALANGDVVTKWEGGN